MKKIFTLLIISTLSVNLFAQITILDTDFAYRGDSYLYAADTLSEGQTVKYFSQIGSAPWNFTDLLTDEEKTIRFVNPAETAYEAIFSTANLCMFGGEDDMVFMNKTAQKVEVTGFVSEFEGVEEPVVFPLVEPVTYIEFPSTAGSNFEDNSVAIIQGTPAELGIDVSGEVIQPDSLRFITTFTLKSEIIDFGTVQLPNGNFESLLQKQTNVIDVDVHAYVFVSWMRMEAMDINDTILIYNWLAKGKGSSVLSMEVRNDSIISTEYMKEGTLKTPIQETAAIEIYPNPCTDKIIIADAKEEISEVQIVSLSGRMLQQFLVKGSRHALPISRLRQGMYLCRLLDTKKKLIGVRKIMKQ